MEEIITTRHTTKAPDGRLLAALLTVPGVAHPKKYPRITFNVGDTTMAENDELTASDLKDILTSNIWSTECSIRRENYYRNAQQP